MAIRWNKDLRARARRIVKNFNAKIKYQTSKGVNLGAVKPMSMRALKKYGSRTDLEAVLRDLKAFSKRGAEKTAYKTKTTDKVYTNWELYVSLPSRRRQALRKAKRELTKLDTHAMTVGGEIYSRRRSALEQLNFDAYQEATRRLLNTKITKNTTARERFHIFKDIQTVERGQTYSNTGRVGNFLGVLEQGGRVTGMESEANNIITKLSKIDPEVANAIMEGEYYVNAIIEEYDKLKNSATNSLKQDAWDNEKEFIGKLSNNIDTIIKEWSGSSNLETPLVDQL